MSKIRRVNFIGGACCGKSSIAPYIYSRLKKNGIKASFAQEFVKEWAYLGREPAGFDQALIFTNQMNREDVPLRCGEDIVVSECPLFLSWCYAEKYNTAERKELLGLLNAFELKYQSLNIFLDRGEIPYVSEGRYGDLESAIDMDNLIIGKLDELKLPYTKFLTTDEDDILEFVLDAIK